MEERGMGGKEFGRKRNVGKDEGEKEHAQNEGVNCFAEYLFLFYTFHNPGCLNVHNL